ncbi:hypothetical protein GQ43DRAFT_64602 [Delitschia confertaspora ATCC 74209]|uniref:Uncharacterized protein n=1 Tax=Delitschia confertaspora ATCC 74209 TaxID=1513339 RepID=A0A9P4MRP5_9PLEO|nr:hypothetical protein GQ43DRAFT_64602 [Delitschia confertaspora ATCC 74209]
MDAVLHRDRNGQPHLAFDIWASRNLKALNGITGQLDDTLGIVRNGLLALSGWDTYTLDNASNNDIAAEYLFEILSLHLLWKHKNNGSLAKDPMMGPCGELL